MKSHHLYALLLFLLVHCGDTVTKPPSIANISDATATKDIQLEIQNLDIFKEETALPIVNECPYNEACSVYESENSVAVCNSGNLYNLPENIMSICTDICNVSDDPVVNKARCADLLTATCCTTIADEDSYFSSLSWCVPSELCCKANEKLCGLNCCHKDWYCGAEGQCLPQCNKDNDCQDDNICTDDQCVEGICQNFDISASPESPYGCCFSDVRCQDNNFCKIDVCQNNQCIHYNNPKCECQPLGGVSQECDDSNIQTADYCRAGNCVHANIPGVCESDSECDDGLDQTKIICKDNTCSLDCIYDCIEKECGLGGCNESCGTCKPGTFCNGWQHCQCDPNYYCKEKECGLDNCGGICGVCPDSYKCNNKGKCECIPKCDDKECGSDSCGGSCGICPIDYICDNSIGKCILQNPCKNLECGWIGEGENAKYCGDCPAGKICGINGKCKTPQLVCDENVFEHNFSESTEMIETSEEFPIVGKFKCSDLGKSGSVLFFPSSDAWLKIKIFIGPDVDLVKIFYWEGGKSFFWSSDGPSTSLYTTDGVLMYSVDGVVGQCEEVKGNSTKLHKNGYIGKFTGGVCLAQHYLMLDSTEDKNPKCPGTSGEAYPVPVSILEDGWIEIMFREKHYVFNESQYTPNWWEKSVGLNCPCNCAMGTCQNSSFSCMCSILKAIKVQSCRYE